jgi:predicted membrane GTPase involved in stress response
VILLLIENPEGLKTIDIDEPTMSMLFTINDSPLGKRVNL